MKAIYLFKKVNNNDWLVMETYEFGTDRKYKTFEKAINQAKKDYNKEVNHYLKEPYYSTTIELSISDDNGVNWYNVKLNVN